MYANCIELNFILGAFYDNMKLFRTPRYDIVAKQTSLLQEKHALKARVRRESESGAGGTSSLCIKAEHTLPRTGRP